MAAGVSRPALASFDQIDSSRRMDADGDMRSPTHKAKELRPSRAQGIAGNARSPARVSPTFRAFVLCRTGDPPPGPPPLPLLPPVQIPTKSPTDSEMMSPGDPR
jgi:hypothetical protein